MSARLVGFWLAEAAQGITDLRAEVERHEVQVARLTALLAECLSVWDRRQSPRCDETRELMERVRAALSPANIYEDDGKPMLFGDFP